jgi:tetratricopeptide (TPR) repeat protein
MNIHMLALSTALVLSAPAFPQETKKQDGAARELEDRRKRLAEIDKVQDDAKRRELLERYIQESPKAPNLDDAYGRLLFALRKTDPHRAIALADEILARPRDPKSRLWRAAYGTKVASLQLLIGQVTEKILSSESDPGLLANAAEFDKDRSLKLLEKAIAERAKNAETDAFPRLEDLHADHARKLSELGKKDEAVKEAARALELAEARVSAIEALPKDDPKRRNLESMKQGLARPRRDLASLLAETGEPEKALSQLARADQVGSDIRPSIEGLRARVYENMAKPDLALESYIRLYSYAMSASTYEKIRNVSPKSGKSADEAVRRARELRNGAAQPFEPFELKTAEGTPTSLKSIRGKVTLVSFFFPT